MQRNYSGPWPPPDINPTWAQSTPPGSSPSPASHQQNSSDVTSRSMHPQPPNPAEVAFQVQPQPLQIQPHTPHATPPPPNPDLLIIGLFSMRLALQLIESLDYYTERHGDITWIKTFLAPYSTSYGLAKLTSLVKQAYMSTYPGIVARMKVQKQYPKKFMDMNPVTKQRRDELARRGGMTDAERLEIIDFADAAREWGSVVHVPEAEALRMVELADQRLIADLK